MKTITILVVAGLLATTAIAGSISRGGSSFSRSTTTSSPARSIGMSRPTVTPPSKAMPSTPAYRSPTPTTSPYVPAPAPTVAPSGGSSFASSFGGSLLGSWLGSSLGSNHGGTTVVNAGGAAPVGAAGTTTVMEPQQSFGSSVWSVFWGFVGLLMIGGLLVACFLFGRWALQRYVRRDDPQGVPFAPVTFFLDVQQSFAKRDLNALRRLLQADLLVQMEQDLPAEASEAKLRNVRYEVLDTSSRAISISYQADDLADDTKIDERWHFTRHSFYGWQLAGIEQN